MSDDKHTVEWCGDFRGTDADPREVGWCNECACEVYDGDPSGHRRGASSDDKPSEAGDDDPVGRLMSKLHEAEARRVCGCTSCRYPVGGARSTLCRAHDLLPALKAAHERGVQQGAREERERTVDAESGELEKAAAWDEGYGLGYEDGRRGDDPDERENPYLWTGGPRR